jgi:hypothetical protein
MGSSKALVYTTQFVNGFSVVGVLMGWFFSNLFLSSEDE